MLKILNEEPTAYDKNLGADALDDPGVWVYKNPTQSEVNELKSLNYTKDDNSGDVRVITDGKDYYVGSAYNFYHSQLTQLTGAHSIIDCVIWFKENIMSIYTRGNEKSTALKPFIPIYKKMLQTGLINEDTILIDSQFDYFSATQSKRSAPDTKEILDGIEVGMYAYT